MFEFCIEFLFSISLIANAICFIPQIVTLYREKNPKSLSLTMFLCFFNAIYQHSVRIYKKRLYINVGIWAKSPHMWNGIGLNINL